MTKAKDRLIKKIHSQNFEKFISVAHKDNGEDFFHEVPPFAKFFSYFCFTIVFVFWCFMSCFLNGLLLLSKLIVIFLPLLCSTWLLRNYKRWPQHMWMPPSRLGGFGGGTHPPMSNPLTSSLPLFLYARGSSMTGFTRLRSGQRYSNPSICFFHFFFCSLSSLTLSLSGFSWIRGLRRRSLPFIMNARLMWIGFRLRMFCNQLITSSIGG